MKTKNLLFLILILGLSFNSFSQEEVTIKQVLKNSSKSDIKGTNDHINYVRVNTSIPVTINKGTENAIYITGEFDGAEDYAGFCTLEDAILKINNPKKGKRIILELANDVNMFYFGNNASVLINMDIHVESNGIFGIENNSIAIVSGIIKGRDLMIRSRNNSKISFYSIDVNNLDVKVEKGSEVNLNGKSVALSLEKDEDSKIIKDTFAYSSLYEATKLIEGDTIKVVVKDKSTKIVKELSDAFAEVAKELNEGDSTENVKSIVEAFKTVSENIEKEGLNQEKSKEKKKESKSSVTSQLGYGISGWSNKVSSIDNLFTSPKGQYSLSYSDSWSLGFRYQYKLSKRWTISTGLGYESNIFRFENNVMLTDINGDKRINLDTTSLDSEGRLVSRYVTVPLFVKFNVYKKFNVHIGAIAGVNFRTSSTGFKRDYDIPNAEVEERWGTKYDNFKPLKLDLQAGFGWGSTNFYVKYAVTSMFKDNKEVAAYPFSVGVSFGL